MAYLLEAATTHPSSTAERSPMAEEARVEPSDRVDSARRALPVNEASAETAERPFGGVDRELEMSVEPPTTELLPKEGIKATAPLLWMMLIWSLRAGLRWWGVEHPLAAEDARVVGGVGSSGTTTRSQELSSGRPL